MALLDSRPRAGYLLLAAIVGHVLLISAQVNVKSGVPILEAAVFGLLAEVQRATSAVTNGASRVWTHYIGLRGAQTENEALKRQLGEAQVELQEQRALINRTRSLEQLLGLKDAIGLKTTGASIIGAGATPDFRTVTIDKGTLDGLRTDMAVIAPAGIVGRIAVTSPRASKVQLLIDRNAAAGALVERSRAQGVMVGSGETRLRMEYVSEVSDVAIGDRVVTSGIDGIYPRGLLIGQVTNVSKSGTAYRQILVQPAVDFASLEEVLVVTVPSGAGETP